VSRSSERRRREKRKIIASALTAAGLPAEGTDEVVSKFNQALNDAGYYVGVKPEPSARPFRGRTLPRSWM
jgi:hypothetical protein